jgi:predicted transcriptional regulator
MSRMQRTQIYLEPELSSSLDMLARELGTTKAHLIRLATRQFLQRARMGSEDPILGIIGLGDGGTGHVSEEHDRVLVQQAAGNANG